MKKWLVLAILGTLVTAVIAHILTLILIPVVLMEITMAKTPCNVLSFGAKQTADQRYTVRPNPDIIGTVVSYDVGSQPIRFTATVPDDTYWSVSLFAQNTDCYFVINDRQVKSNPLEIILVKQGMQCPDAGNAQVVVSPTDKGILLVRHILPSQERLTEVLQIQEKAFITLGCK
jgi:uncharacterized membrane protein